MRRTTQLLHGGTNEETHYRRVRHRPRRNGRARRRSRWSRRCPDCADDNNDARRNHNDNDNARRHHNDDARSNDNNLARRNHNNRAR